MKKLLVLLILILSALWIYASWYWYTCLIKWFCQTNNVTVSSEINNQPLADETIETLDAEDEIQSDDLTDNEIPVVVIEEEIEPIDDDVSENEDSSDQESLVGWWTQDDNLIDSQDIASCEDLIVTPIRLWNENDSGDVKDLEDFLNAFEWESLEVNWVYEQADFEAVKRFQLKYAADILTPWWIENPTGYVFRTTTEKINEIYCNK